MAASALSSSSRTCGLTILTSLASCDCGGVRVPFAQCASVSAWTPSRSASRCRSSGSLMIVCKISVQGGEEGIILLLLVDVLDDRYYVYNSRGSIRRQLPGEGNVGRTRKWKAGCKP